MKKNATYNKLLNTAYYEFANNGPDFSLKSLAQKTALPRASFYYHFINKEDLITELLNYHITNAKKIQEELKEIDVLIPDLYAVLYRHIISVQFHQQLLYNCHIATFKTLYSEANKICVEILLPHIKNHFEFQQSDEEVFRFYNTLTDAWYSRQDFSNTSVEEMTKLAEEITGNVLALHNVNKAVKPTLR
jgi:AcrR family transcriptional regulator